MGLPEASPALREAERYLASLELFGMRLRPRPHAAPDDGARLPQERFESIHVVGSNGKSSTARMIAALLERQGVRTGAYLSPHLVSWAERIEVGRAAGRRRALRGGDRPRRRAAAKVDRTLEPGDRVTQFEALTAAAYWELARAGVEVAVVEAGLGGRYDATSVIRVRRAGADEREPRAHALAGPTERHIAEEKLAVVPPGGTLVAGPLGPEAPWRDVAERMAAERGARLLDARARLHRSATTCGSASARGRSSARTSRSRWRPRRYAGALDAAPCARRAGPSRRRAGWRWSATTRS